MTQCRWCVMSPCVDQYSASARFSPRKWNKAVLLIAEGGLGFGVFPPCALRFQPEYRQSPSHLPDSSKVVHPGSWLHLFLHAHDTSHLLSRLTASKDHLATRELYLAAVPLFACVCDFFIVVTPPVAGDDAPLGTSAYFRDGFCCVKCWWCLCRQVHCIAKSLTDSLRIYLRAMTRLVQSGAARETCGRRPPQPVSLRLLRRYNPAGHE